MVDDDNVTTVSSKLPLKDRSLRAYSKKHRVYVFREFLLDTYGDYFFHRNNKKANDDNQSYLSESTIILDVAGGKGDLSWLLHNVDNLHSVVMDPRRTNNHIERSVEFLRQHPDECERRALRDQHTYQPIATLMAHLQRKKFVLQSPTHLRIFVDQELVDVVKTVQLLRQHQRQHHQTEDMGLLEWSTYFERAMQRSQGFVTPTGKNDFSIHSKQEDILSQTNTITDAFQALHLIESADIIVGFHPDQATDYCFQLAELLQIPVCVVPCCVFPSEFPHRRLRTGSQIVPVEKHEDLIAYLLQEFPSLQTTQLDFAGTTTARNTVLYTLPTTPINGIPNTSHPT